MDKEKNELAAAVADDPEANEDYQVTSALGGPPVPPEVFPEELAKQQSVEQGGDREVTLGDGDPDGEGGTGSGAASGTASGAK